MSGPALLTAAREEQVEICAALELLERFGDLPAHLAGPLWEELGGRPRIRFRATEDGMVWVGGLRVQAYIATALAGRALAARYHQLLVEHTGDSEWSRTLERLAHVVATTKRNALRDTTAKLQSLLDSGRRR